MELEDLPVLRIDKVLPSLRSRNRLIDEDEGVVLKSRRRDERRARSEIELERRKGETAERIIELTSTGSSPGSANLQAPNCSSNFVLTSFFVDGSGATR